MDGILIEPATKAVIAAVHALEQRCFPAPWRIEFFQGELELPGRFNLVVSRDGVLIGYLFAMWFFDEMHINKIAVVEHERRRGIALELMNRCTDFARDHAVKTISLEVRRSNKGAQEFYKRLGFASGYIRKGYYPDGEAAVVMTKALVSE